MGLVKENVMGKRIPGYTTRNLFLTLLAVSAAMVVLVPALSQEAGKAEKVAPRDVTEVRGSKLFHSYCASCHGADAKGHGPTAASLKTDPPDLTLLAQRNGGKFPVDHVIYVLGNEGQQSVHGSKEMPVWGPIFRKVGGGDENMGHLRTHNLTDYLKSFQAK
jgi:mono/diheme cytochrome c family protein